MDGNIEVWQVLQAGCTQLRVGGFGGTIGFDYNALKLLADSMAIDTPQAFWVKVHAVENVIRKIEHRQQEREKLKSKHK